MDERMIDALERALAKTTTKKELLTEISKEEYMFAVPSDFNKGSIAKKEPKPMTDIIASVMNKPKIDLSKVQNELDKEFEEGVNKLDIPLTPEEIVGII